MFIVLYDISLWHIYYSLQVYNFKHYQSYLPTPHLLFTPLFYPIFFFLQVWFFSDSICKWYLIVLAFLCLTYLAEHNVLKSQSCRGKWQDMQPSHGWVILFIYMLHIHTHTHLFDALMHCFHFSAVNNAVINMGVHISLWNPIFIFFRYILSIYLDLPGHMGDLFLMFWRRCILFSMVFRSICTKSV